jgi:hypothetical protein
MNAKKVLRKELLALLEGGNAHMDFEEAVEGFPMEAINKTVPHGGYTIWHLVEHMRIVQWDILEFVRNPDHVSPDFPEGYWPNPDETATPARWRKSIRGFLADVDGFIKIAKNPRTDFLSPIPHAQNYAIFREILLASDHNAYPIGELASLRGALNLNPV